MSEISSIDTSFYPGLIEGFAPKTTLPVPAVDAEARDGAAAYSNDGRYSDSQRILAVPHPLAGDHAWCLLRAAQLQFCFFSSADTGSCSPYAESGLGQNYYHRFCTRSKTPPGYAGIRIIQGSADQYDAFAFPAAGKGWHHSQQCGAWCDLH